MNLAVKMSDITMRFGKVVANEQVNLDVKKGEILALVGENGAGKSTLMNILYGLYSPTEGRVYIDGKEIVFHSAIDAMKAGVGMVHQHFMLIPRLTVAENIVLGEEPRKWIKFNKKETHERLNVLCEQYEMKLDIEEKVENISLGMQQKVEIMKALYRQADILILDEPTAVLTPQEIDELGKMLKNLKDMGKTIIIITHKLQEVLDFSDRVTVLRRGKLIGSVNTCDTTAEQITEMMVGRSVHLGGNKKEVKFTEDVLRIKDVSYHNGKKQKLRNINLHVRKGEILGIAGIDNSGQRELTEVVAGVLKPTTGTVSLLGEEIQGKAVHFIKNKGVGFIPQDRHQNGLALSEPVKENMILGYQRLNKYIKHKIFMDESAIAEDVKKKIEDFDVRPDDMTLMTRGLSGGNQQKIIVAREVSNASTLIIADQPSRGVDVGAIELIHEMLVDARNDGEAVLLISLELDEVMMLSDRIAVLYDGEIMGIIEGNKATREDIGLMMAGGRVAGSE